MRRRVCVCHRGAGGAQRRRRCGAKSRRARCRDGRKVKDGKRESSRALQWSAAGNQSQGRKNEVKEGERRQEHSKICTMQSQDASQRLRIDGPRWCMTRPCGCLRRAASACMRGECDAPAAGCRGRRQAAGSRASSAARPLRQAVELLSQVHGCHNAPRCALYRKGTAVLRQACGRRRRGGTERLWKDDERKRASTCERSQQAAARLCNKSPLETRSKLSRP